MSEYKNVIEERYEFLLYINNHIIVQRFFNIPYANEDVLDSMDLKWLHESCVGLIQENLMKKTREDLWKRFNPYVVQTQDKVPTRGIYDKPSTFTFEIKVDKETAITGNFDGSIYSPGARYEIDIKSLIPVIIRKIKNVFRQKEFTHFYGEVEL